MKERTVLVAQTATVPEELPARVTEALGELVGAAREGCWRCLWASDWASSLS